MEGRGPQTNNKFLRSIFKKRRPLGFGVFIVILSMLHLMQELTDVPAADDLHHRLQLESHTDGAPRQGNYCLLTLFIRTIVTVIKVYPGYAVA